ncbi:hypothetical protein CYMTET_47962 [Cymbomonas tetramitiformis]|uniref:Uncharacterized protein n=1 Tax=Cymbomonas tetramitiformis TaxID=36881 RepID=A0AAE0BU97_9CHLO|nr:hypothetical protein CYMTET_47962 [Cymbomonas tetramitiformis]
MSARGSTVNVAVKHEKAKHAFQEGKQMSSVVQVPESAVTQEGEATPHFRKTTRSAATLSESRRQEKLLGHIGHVLQLLEKSRRLRNIYLQLIRDLCRVLFYLSILGLQYSALQPYTLVSALRRAIVPATENGVPEFMDWLKIQVLEVWTDPTCGDGVCHEPIEFPSFGRLGCKADCGEADVTPLLVYVEADFYEVDGTMLSIALMEKLRTR